MSTISALSAPSESSFSPLSFSGMLGRFTTNWKENLSIAATVISVIAFVVCFIVSSVVGCLVSGGTMGGALIYIVIKRGQQTAQFNQAVQSLRAANQELVSAQSQLELSNRELHIQNSLLQQAITDSRQSLGQLRTENQTLQESNRELDIQRRHLQGENQHLQDTARILQETNHRLETTNTNLQENLSHFRADISSIGHIVEQLGQGSQTLGNEVNQMSENVNSLDRNNERIEAIPEAISHIFDGNLHDLARQISQLNLLSNTQTQTTVRNLQELRQENAHLQASLHGLTTQANLWKEKAESLEGLNKELSKKAEHLEALEKSIGGHQEKIEQISALLGATGTQLDQSLSTKIRRKEDSVQQEQNVLQQLLSTLEKRSLFEQELEQKITKYKKLDETIRQGNVEVQTKLTELRQLKNELKPLQQLQEENTVLRTEIAKLRASSQ